MLQRILQRAAIIIAFVAMCNCSDTQNIQIVNASLKDGNYPEFLRGRLFVVDSFLIGYDNRAKSVIRLFKNNGEFLGEFGNTGKGPEEMTNPTRASVYKTHNEFRINDTGKDVTWVYYLDSLCLHKKLRIKSIEKFPPFLIVPHNELKIDDTTLAFWSHENNSDIMLINTNTMKVSYFSEPTVPSFNTPGFVNQSQIASFSKHPTKNMYVIAYYLYDQVKIINRETTQTIIFNGAENEVSKSVQQNWLKRKMYYGKPKVTDQEIFVEYYGKQATRIEDGRKLRNWCTELHVFNWDGDLKRKILLDEEYSDFNIDKDNDRIFFVTMYDDRTLKYIDYKFEKR